jgi:hypothetical protein
VEGASEASHTIEMEKRIESGLLDWTDGSAQAPPSLFGYGLGVMSNGSEKLSPYAAKWRSDNWTETDQATTFFEGGWYLVSGVKPKLALLPLGFVWIAASECLAKD